MYKYNSPSSKINLCLKSFKSLNAFKNYIIKHKKLPDTVAINNIAFSMEEYDMAGKQLFYANRRTKQQIEINWHDRYKNMSSIISIEQYPSTWYRNDITYID